MRMWGWGVCARVVPIQRSSCRHAGVQTNTTKHIGWPELWIDQNGHLQHIRKLAVPGWVQPGLAPRNRAPVALLTPRGIRRLSFPQSAHEHAKCVTAQCRQVALRLGPQSTSPIYRKSSLNLVLCGTFADLRCQCSGCTAGDSHARLPLSILGKPMDGWGGHTLASNGILGSSISLQNCAPHAQVRLQATTPVHTRVN